MFHYQCSHFSNVLDYSIHKMLNIYSSIYLWSWQIGKDCFLLGKGLCSLLHPQSLGQNLVHNWNSISDYSKLNYIYLQTTCRVFLQNFKDQCIGNHSSPMPMVQAKRAFSL